MGEFQECYLGGPKGTLVNLASMQPIASGGAGQVYNLGYDQKKKCEIALKILKPSDHVEFTLPEMQQATIERLNTYQTKIPELIKIAKKLPIEVITPLDIATDKSGLIIGYTMRKIQIKYSLARLLNPRFRKKKNYSYADVVNVFILLHDVIKKMHLAGIISGDLNPRNIVIDDNNRICILDIDSATFGSFKCEEFTEQYTDPSICEFNEKNSLLVKTGNYTKTTDWYSFETMLFEMLLGVHPYGGNHVSKTAKNIVHDNNRGIMRISVFHKEVPYPTSATPFKVLPNSLLKRFRETFEKGKRVKADFPLGLIQQMNWVKCSKCNLEHSQKNCPDCKIATPAPTVKTLTQTIRESVLFQTNENVLFATCQNGAVKFIHQKGKRLYRENGSFICDSSVNPQYFAIRNNYTYLLFSDREIQAVNGRSRKKVGTGTTFASNNSNCYWVDGIKLMRDGIHIGDVAQGNTLVWMGSNANTALWVGSKFGFGLYLTKEQYSVFSFDVSSSKMTHDIKLPLPQGRIIDYSCILSSNLCWLFVTTLNKKKKTNSCILLSPDGKVLAKAEDNDWILGKKCTFDNQNSNFILVYTEKEGMIKIQPDWSKGTLVKTQRFPAEIKSFITPSSAIFLGPKGIYAVDRQKVSLLSIN